MGICDYDCMNCERMVCCRDNDDYPNSFIYTTCEEESGSDESTTYRDMVDVYLDDIPF